MLETISHHAPDSRENYPERYLTSYPTINVNNETLNIACVTEHLARIVRETEILEVILFLWVWLIEENTRQADMGLW